MQVIFCGIDLKYIDLIFSNTLHPITQCSSASPSVSETCKQICKILKILIIAQDKILVIMMEETTTFSFLAVTLSVLGRICLRPSSQYVRISGPSTYVSLCIQSDNFCRRVFPKSPFKHNRTYALNNMMQMQVSKTPYDKNMKRNS